MTGKAELVREFARLFWDGRPAATEAIVMGALVFTAVVIVLGWPLWAVAAVWVGVQVAAMAAWAGWQAATGRTGGGGDGGQ